MAALPDSFFTPATVLLSSVSGVRSVAQACADLYISQKAVLPETGLAGAEGFAASVSLLGDAFGVWEQEVRKKTHASTAAALKRLLNIGTYNSRHRAPV
jgi:hypothetical protein